MFYYQGNSINLIIEFYSLSVNFFKKLLKIIILFCCFRLSRFPLKCLMCSCQQQRRLKQSFVFQLLKRNSVRISNFYISNFIIDKIFYFIVKIICVYVCGYYCGQKKTFLDLVYFCSTILFLFYAYSKLILPIFRLKNQYLEVTQGETIFTVHSFPRSQKANKKF